jgi:TDG/mug DNA glycosylase family protein
MRAYCRVCDEAVEAAGAWPGACGACGAPVEEHPVPDVVAPALRVLFVGINPGIRTARERLHFANPRNAFWGALRDAGFIPADFAPGDQPRLVALGLGITNVVTRATPGSADVTKEDVERGRARLHALVREEHPEWLAFVGKEAYKMATGERAVDLGENAPLEGARTFVLPSTSPRNAHWTPEEKLAWFVRLREAAMPPG